MSQAQTEQSSDTNTARRWYARPVVHFIVLGGLLFGLDALVNPADKPAQDAHVIVVTPDQIQRLKHRYASRSGQAGQPPETVDGDSAGDHQPLGDQERSQLVDDYVRDEVLYRQALELGLHHSDTIVRRRLIQAMRLLTEDLAAPGAPSDEELSRWFHDHADDYRKPARLTFEHYFVAGQDDTANQRAAAIGRALEAGRQPDDQGDAFVGGKKPQHKTMRDIQQSFGAGFAAAVDDLGLDQWSAPIKSSYGWHVVRIDRRTPGRLPALDQVRRDVRQDLVVHQRKQATRRAIDQMRAKYEVRTPAEASRE